ncbi:MAG TPA: AsmA family protein [Terriglobia bacterium]|nr:AsmA family protein [Terriglobia bacterium]
MKYRKRRYVRNGLAALVLLLAACWIVPSFFSAERYRRNLEAALQRALDRQVTFGAVSFRLLPRPGFSIENAVVHEDPAFGAEPLARVDRIDCDLRWRSLLHSRFDFSRLYLDHPSFNLVRNERGEWNVESFLRKTGLASPTRPSAGTAAPRDNLDLTADDARIDFTVASVKKPFTLMDVRARVSFDRQRSLLSFRLEGSPMRTDLSLPTPGLVQLEGQWTPGTDLEGPLDAELRTQSALIYDWIPLVSGRNPEIYGLLDAQIHLTGSLHHLNLEGQSNISQLHRWEQVPPSDPLPSALFFRGHFDRTRGQAVIEGLDWTFANSRIHLTGSIEKIPTAPEMDLVVSVERSRLEDFVALGRRLSGKSPMVGISGRVDSLLTIQGEWSHRQFSGFAGARDIDLSTPSGSFPVSDFNLQIGKSESHIAPIRITLAPHAELELEAVVGQSAPAVPARKLARKSAEIINDTRPRYQISIVAKAAPAHDLIGFARAIGLLAAPGLDARGSASVEFTLTGAAWPLGRPSVDGSADLRAASILVPGLTEPIHLPRAHVQVTANHVIADPVVAVLGTSVFTGRLEHQGDRTQPWQFDIHANTLSLEQGSLWFDVLGRRQPESIFERLPGLSSFGEVRVAASNLFGALKAHGRFACPNVSYRALSLADFKSNVDIAGRTINLEGATFRAASGKGQGGMMVDFTSAPARVAIDVSMADGNLQSLASRLPIELRKVRGTFSGAGHFETRGLSHAEITSNLQGSATVRLNKVFLGDYDPLQALARQEGWGILEPSPVELNVPSVAGTLEVHDRRVVLGNAPVKVAGGELKLSGAYSFDGAVDLDVRADVRHFTRRWLNVRSENATDSQVLEVHLLGPLDKLQVAPEIAASRPTRPR